VTAYDIAAWSDFAGTTSDVASALAGLLFYWVTAAVVAGFVSTAANA
jgi:hypothetical protein